MIRRRFGGIAAVMTAGLLALTVGIVASGDTQVTALEPDTGLPVVPRTDTPRFIGGTVWDQAQVGNLIVVAGSFEQVQDSDGTLIDQAYLAAYNIDSGRLVRSFDPELDKEVLALEPDGAGGMVIGGKFNTIDGQSQRKIARLNADGTRNSSFRAEASAKVGRIAVNNGRVYAGGPFSSVRRSGGTWFERERLAAFLLADGSVDTAFDFPITGPAGRGGDLSVKGLGFAGNDLVVSHSGLQVAGQPRVGAAIIRTTPLTAPTLRAWQTDFYQVNTIDQGRQLANTEMAVSPDGTYFVVVASGGDRPLQGNDSAVRFPVAGGAGVQPTWISRHFDSMFSVGITDRAVYVGGHFQFQEAPGSTNPYPGDPNINYGAGGAGLGAAILGNEVVARKQLGALDPNTGKSLNWNPGSNSNIGVESLVPIPRGLLVGHDGDILGDKDIGRHGFFDVSVDVTPPTQLDTAITSHFNGELADAGQVTLAGTASDSIAIGRVQLAVRHLPTGQYLQPDGSLGSWIGINADLDNPGATNSNWSKTLTFTTQGRYSIQAKTFAADKRKDGSPAWVELSIRPADDARPELQWNVSHQIDGRTITATGIANDDRGIERVIVTVINRDTNLYLQANGTMGPNSHGFLATLAAPGAPDTNYSITVTVPEDGRFQLNANPIDSAGQDDQKFEQKNLVIASVNTAPTIETDRDVAVEVPTNGRFTVSGTAADAEGIAELRVQIYEQVYRTGTRPDNTFGAVAAYTYIRAAEGETSYDFAYTSPQLPIGLYVAVVQVRDDLGQAANSVHYLEVGPVGDAQPNTTIDAEDRQIYEPTQTLQVQGAATDDVGVNRVEVFVYEYEERRWVGPDGSFTAGPVAHPTTLNDPGATSTRFSWVMQAPVEGRYRIWALAIDSSGQRNRVTGRSQAFQDWTPGDGPPTVGRITPETDAVLNGDQIFFTGRAEDETAVARVRFAIRREADRTWLRADDSWGGFQWTDAALTNGGRPGTNWDYATPVIGPDRYLIIIEALDDVGKRTRDQFYVTLN